MEYAQHCRRLIANNKAEPSVYDIMPTGPDAPPEHIILDENINAQEYDYYSIGVFKGSCKFNLHTLVQIINWWPMQRTRKVLRYIPSMSSTRLKGLTCYLQWAGKVYF
ncbi:unnamed protein product [Brassica oleracea]|uniref:(rape) hypothetical protein n=1 Tax=Brassica napus TaxID=3708 RepID=A0A816Q118_BRANA|nr:unnamed protein product [Brassica napus]